VTFPIASGGLLFVSSDEKYAKNAAKNQWFLDFLLCARAAS